MGTQSMHTAFLAVMLDPTATRPLYRQLYDTLRLAILTGELAGGTRLPSTRAFARNLGISRTTVMIAFEQLLYACAPSTKNANIHWSSAQNAS
jgi:DNA-binding transcriptional regulator YhcF (GntR family)